MNLLTILNLLTFALPLLFLIVFLVYFLRKGEIKLCWIKIGIFAMLALWIIIGAYSTIATYNLWKIDPLIRYLLPPYSPISYFAGYAFFHFWLNCGIIIMLSLLWVFVLWLINKFSQSRFLDKTDIYLSFFTGLVAGWPNFIFFVSIFFGLMLARQIVDVVIFKKNESLEVAPYLIAGALIALIAGEFLINKLELGVLRI